MFGIIAAAGHRGGGFVLVTLVFLLHPPTAGCRISSQRDCSSTFAAVISVPPKNSGAAPA